MTATLLLSLLAASPEAPLRVVVVTGGHGFEAEPFWAMWDALPGLTWREVTHPAAGDLWSPEQRDSWDLIVLYDMVQAITAEQQGWLLDCLREGRGLLVMHHAIANFQAWPEYARLIGGKFRLQPETVDGRELPASTWREGLTYTVEPVGDHPIVRGLAPFAIEDEVYGDYWVADDVTPLLRVDHPDSGEFVGWSRTEGRARVVYLMPGHGHGAFASPEYRELLRRCVAWTARRDGEPTADRPAGRRAAGRKR